MRSSHIAVLILAIGGCSSGRGGGTGGTGNNGSTTTSQSGSVDGGGSGGGGGGGGGGSVDGGTSGTSVYNTGPCDTSVVGQNTAAALTAAIGLCDSTYVTGSKFNGPSVAEGRTTVGTLGVVKSLEGSAMAYLSNGDAVSNSTSSSYQTDEGTDQSAGGTNTTYASPYSTLTAPPDGCGNNKPAAKGNDYEELEIDLTVPPGVNSFSFQFQFFSAEYPTYVCSEYNDRFLAVVEDGTNAQQVAFDSKNNPVTVDSGFFTICTNGGFDSQFQTLNGCTTPVSAISGSGFGDQDNGGSTGWLTTTVPATPGDNIKLRYIIYDEGDHVLDSSVLIDNFQWLGGTVTAPTTIQ